MNWEVFFSFLFSGRVYVELALFLLWRFGRKHNCNHLELEVFFFLKIFLTQNSNICFLLMELGPMVSFKAFSHFFWVIKCTTLSPFLGSCVSLSPRGRLPERNALKQEKPILVHSFKAFCLHWFGPVEFGGPSIIEEGYGEAVPRGSQAQTDRQTDIAQCKIWPPRSASKAVSSSQAPPPKISGTFLISSTSGDHAFNIQVCRV